MELHIVPGDAVPLYRQIVRQVAGAVAAGRLAPGDRLPSHRELARQLVVAPLTVKKAYDHLEQDGIVVSRHGSGTYVAERPATDRGADREHLAATARQLVAGAWLAGLDDAAVHELVDEAADRLRRDRPAPTPSSSPPSGDPPERPTRRPT